VIPFTDMDAPIRVASGDNKEGNYEIFNVVAMLFAASLLLAQKVNPN